MKQKKDPQTLKIDQNQSSKSIPPPSTIHYVSRSLQDPNFNLEGPFKNKVKS